jgi:uncharacterized protein YjiS (DUF1127 family)
MTMASTTTHAPSGSGFAGELVHSLAAAAAGYWRKRVNRRRVKALLELDDHLLADIGLTRADIDTALGSAADASAVLKELSHRHRG